MFGVPFFRGPPVRLLVLCGFLALSLTSHPPAAAAEGDQVGAQDGDASAPILTDAQAYLAKIDATLELASKGQYGNLERGSDKRLQAARSRIADLLQSRHSIGDLPLADRMAVQNAEDVISSILRNKEKDRMVCRRDLQTGTRFSSTECLTVAEREARSVAAGASTLKAQQTICYPGEGQSCN